MIRSILTNARLLSCADGAEGYALQNAASVSGLLLTTEAMIAEAPKKDSPAPAMPGGGMGGMDF